MEYSVYDLVRILLKKWYIILITMAAIGGLAWVSAQKSYEKVLADYEQYTSETITTGVETGTTVAAFRYTYRVNDLSKYTSEYETKAAFLQNFADNFHAEAYGQEDKNSVYALAEQAFAKVSEDFSRLLTDSLVMAGVQNTVGTMQYQEPPTIDAGGVVYPSAGPLVSANHMAVELLDATTFRVTVSGLEEAVAQEMIRAYTENLLSVGSQDYALDVAVTPLSTNYFPNPILHTSTAQLAQTVMQKPEQAPIMVKTVGTAAAYAFVLACFLILLFTFIKDMRPSRKNASKAA